MDFQPFLVLDHFGGGNTHFTEGSEIVNTTEVISTRKGGLRIMKINTKAAERLLPAAASLRKLVNCKGQ